MKALWKDCLAGTRFDSLNGNIKTDVLIVGGGITGVLCAHMLKKAGVDCILVEAGKIGGGVTGNTTAKITVQHGLIYDKIIRKYGVEIARLYFESQKDALEYYRILCENIDCDFSQCDSYVYSLDDRAKIETEINAFEKIGCVSDFCEKTELPFSIAGAVRIKNQAQFHPLKFLFSIAKDLPIYENTVVKELKPDCAITQNGKIFSEKTIIATHFPFINKHGSYFLKMYQHRSYVIALKNAGIVKNMYIDESMKGLSFRGFNDLLLVGGGSHRTGKKGGNWQELSDIANNFYPDATESYRWATQDCMTLDGIAYIGQYSKNTPGLYVASGFNKWGMTSAMTSAMLLCDMICGKDNEYLKVYSPSRSMMHPQLAINSAEALIGLLKPTAPRCPHMGCALEYNKAEHTWDCPCHGSRFSESGELIDNPATEGKKM